MDHTCACCNQQVAESVHLQCHAEIRICHRCLDWLNTTREKQINARSAGWRVAGFEPIFPVADVALSTDHYRRLGFEISHHDESYAFAHREKDLTIHLTVGGSDTLRSSLYIHCDDADALAEEWRLAGLEVTGPKDEDYGKREGSHTDPDGNLLRFGSPLGSPSP